MNRIVPKEHDLALTGSRESRTVSIETTSKTAEYISAGIESRDLINKALDTIKDQLDKNYSKLEGAMTPLDFAELKVQMERQRGQAVDRLQKMLALVVGSETKTKQTSNTDKVNLSLAEIKTQVGDEVWQACVEAARNNQIATTAAQEVDE